MKVLVAYLVVALTMASCQDGKLPMELQNDENEIDTKCTSIFFSASLTGDFDTDINAVGSSLNSVTSYATPSGIRIKGQQNGVSITIDITVYTGPGEYNISETTNILIDATGGNAMMTTYRATSGVISIDEFRSPEDELCVKGLFSFDSSIIGTSLDGNISVTNGEFEATIS